MRKIFEFSFVEWLNLAPLIHAFKQLRNDLLLLCYLKKKASNLADSLKTLETYRNKNIAVIIAFEQPWALDFLLQMAIKNLSDLQLLVCDNSKNIEAKNAIKAICQKYNTPYIELPSYNTSHVNRSHGVAMTWAYHKIIKSIQPSIFGFIDHDLIPIAPTTIENKLANQMLYGQKNKGHKQYWSLWAGYCFYNFDIVKNKPLNFLYDFSRGLDTGGRNWNSIYRKYNEDNLTFATNSKTAIKLLPQNQNQDIEIVDENWWHLSGISYNNNFSKRANLFEFFSKKLLEGESFKNLITQNSN